MGTVRSVKRERFERDTFPHLESLWRTALWLTMRRSFAEELVLRTMTNAYRTWSGSVDSAYDRARLFRCLAREFSDSNDQRPQGRGYIPENGETVMNSDNGSQPYCLASIDRRELSLLTRISHVPVKAAIARLRPQSRLIVLLLVRERFSYSDIAYITDIRMDSVRSILRRIRRLIPRYLTENVTLHMAAKEGGPAIKAPRVSSDAG